MSIATEISRLQTDRNTIRAKLVELGMATNTDNLDTLAATIENLVNQGAVSVEILEGTTYTIPKGYHNGSGTVKAITDALGEAEKYKTQVKTATPTKKQQSITPDSGYYALSSVTVSPIPDAYQDVTSVTAETGDVLTGKVYVTSDGTVVTGTMANNGTVSKTLDVTTITYTIPKGYHNGSGTVKIVLEEKSVTPSKSTQSVTPTSGKVLKKVTVNPIPDAYQDVTGVTATADKVLEGSTFVDAEGNEVEGTMVDHSDVKYITPLTVERNAYTIPEGYYNGEQTITVAGGGIALVTPTKEAQEIEGSWVDDGTGNLAHKGYLSVVVVEAIPDEYQDVTAVDADAADVLTGKTIVSSTGAKVTGAMPNNGAVSKKLDATSGNQSYTVPKGYHSGTGTVAITLEEKSATPTKSTQNITPTSGKVLSKVTVNPIPSNYITTTDATATAADILVDTTAYVKGSKVTGSMPNNGAFTSTINGLTTLSVAIPKGYHSGAGTISLTNDIETALAAI